MTSTHRDKRLLALLAAGAVLLAGCGGGGDSETAESSATAPSETTINPSDMQNDQSVPDRLQIDVQIKGAEVTPTNQQLEAKVNQPIVVRVNSDVADELHVHSNPEHTFNIEAKPMQQFQFAVGVPGQVDIELHKAGVTVATVQVQP